MPITSRQFDLGISPQIADWIAKVQKFLRQHPSQGYSEEDLREALSCDDLEANAVLSKALQVLTDFESLEKRWVNDTSYYMYRGEPVEPLA
jgi:hypothetical protein